MSDRPVAEAQHTHSDTSHSVGFLLMSDRPVAEAQHTTLTTDRHNPAGFETTIPKSERRQNHSLDSKEALFGSDTSIRVIL